MDQNPEPDSSDQPWAASHYNCRGGTYDADRVAEMEETPAGGVRLVLTPGDFMRLSVEPRTSDESWPDNDVYGVPFLAAHWRHAYAFERWADIMWARMFLAAMPRVEYQVVDDDGQYVIFTNYAPPGSGN